MGVSQFSVDTELRNRIFPGATPLSVSMRNFDWSSSSLGPCEAWSEILRTSISICLSSSFPMALCWGPERIFLYNDAYVSFLGPGKHPHVLGHPAKEAWPEIWTTIGPMIDQVQNSRTAYWTENTALYINRNIAEEEVYLTFSFSPIFAPDGTIAGILSVATETSETIVSTRRLEILRRLGLTASSAAGVKEACQQAISILSDNLQDIPSAAIYVTDDVRGITRLTASSGFLRNCKLPYSLGGSDDPDCFWPMAQVLRSRTMAVVPEQNGHAKSLVLPIIGNPGEALAGLLVIGLSSHRVLDAAYVNYCEAIAGHVGTAIRDARRYQFERMRAETLMELDKSKTAFFSNVSHEFRTPLTLILAPLEDALSLLSDDLNAEPRESIKMAHRNAMRLLRLVQTLLDFSRIEARRSTANYEAVDLSLLTSDLASIFRSAIERAGLEFRVRCESLSDQIYVDRDMWEKIVLNMISNAFKFTFKGFIEVALVDRGDTLQLVVSDSGIGISNDDMAKIFERFHRIEGGRARTYDGSGIGLALVKELVEMHGGTIHACSREGEGSQFIVTLMKGCAHLPKDRINLRTKSVEKDISRNIFVEEALGWLPDKERLTVVSKSEGDRNRGSGARILVADDNADMRHYLSRLLSKRWLVVEASDGEEAWSLMQVQHFDLILCDVMMPRLDGFGLLKKLRNDPALQAIPLILLSARAGEESRIEGLQTGADDYLIKPFSAREVLARIQAHLQIAAVRKAAADDRMASEAKSAFLANMSHEIRTPLGAITGFAELLMNMNLSDKERIEYTEAIRRNGRLLTHIVNDILDFSKVESGMLSIETLNISLTAMLEELATLFSAIASRKGIRFLISSEGTIPKRIATDPTRLQQVLINVIGNAIKFTQTGQVEVFVSAQPRENDAVRLMFRVKDSGLGISADQRKRLFQAFVQADVSTTRNFGGTGLGLVLARKLANALGGDVELVESELGVGSTFLISIESKALGDEAECSDETGRYASEVGEPLQHLKGMRILLVDDGPDMRFLVSQILESEGAIIEQAENGRQGLEKALEADFDVVLMDMQMPICDGFVATAELRKQGYLKPIIALSAAVMNAERQRALEAGCDDHITKPVNVAYLVEKLSSYLDGSYKSVPIERDTLLPFSKASGESLSNNSGLS